MSPWRLCAGFYEACLRPILQLPPRNLEQIHDIARPETPPDRIHADGLELPKAPPVFNCCKRRVRFRPKSTQKFCNLLGFRVKPLVNRVVCLAARGFAALPGVG